MCPCSERAPLCIDPYWAFCLRPGHELLGHHQRNYCLAEIAHSLNAPGPTPVFLHPFPDPCQGNLELITVLMDHIHHCERSV